MYSLRLSLIQNIIITGNRVPVPLINGMIIFLVILTILEIVLMVTPKEEPYWWEYKSSGKSLTNDTRVGLQSILQISLDITRPTLDLPETSTSTHHASSIDAVLVLSIIVTIPKDEA